MSRSEKIITILSERDIRLSSIYLDAIRILDSPEVEACLNAYDAINQRMWLDIGALIYRFKRHSENEYEGGMIIEGVGLHQTGKVRDDLIRHGRDEKRHHKMFKGMADQLCRQVGYLPIEPRKSSGTEIVEAFSAKGGVYQFMCSLHMAEVRNYFILNGYKDSFLDRKFYSNIKFIKNINRIFNDELDHISYTAHYVSRWSEENVDISKELKFYAKRYPTECWHEMSEMTNYFSCNNIISFDDEVNFD